MSQIRIEKTFEDAIYDYMAAVLDASFGANVVPVIWDKQIADSENNPNPKRPPLPYVTLNISTPPFKEGDSEIKYKELDTYTLPMRKAFTVTASVYAKAEIPGGFGYYDVMVAITDGLELESFKSILRKAGLAIRGSENPIDLTALLETVFEFRSSVDIFLAYAKPVDDITGQIDKVGMTGEIGDFEVSQTIPQS